MQIVDMVGWIGQYQCTKGIGGWVGKYQCTIQYQCTKCMGEWVGQYQCTKGIGRWVGQYLSLYLLGSLIDIIKVSQNYFLLLVLKRRLRENSLPLSIELSILPV